MPMLDVTIMVGQLEVENCRAFKFKVQSLLDSGWWTFQENKPNVEKNPLSGHAGPSTNAVISEEGQGLIKSVKDIKSLLKDIFSLICQMGYFKLVNRLEDSCGFHLWVPFKSFG